MKKLTECNTLEELFESWQAKQVEEVNKLSEAIHNSSEKICVSEMFIKEHYKKKGNTISSQFIQFFNKDNCKNCSKNKGILSGEETSWEYVLKNAFNMDGSVGTFDVGEGFGYIFLLKEANDSKKTCIDDYPKFKLNQENVNKWLQDWLDSEEKNNPKMLTKINNALKKYLGLGKEEEFVFTSKAAYMNVNKRGGTFSTKGYDESAVINYAQKYKEYILKEIELLANQREKVTVFVCGGKGYFERLMKALGDKEENEFKKYEIPRDNTKVVFVNIPHPSGRISADKLANSMKEG